MDAKKICIKKRVRNHLKKLIQHPEHENSIKKRTTKQNERAQAYIFNSAVIFEEIYGRYQEFSRRA